MVQPNPTMYRARVIGWATLFGAVVLSLLLLANSMIKPVSRDEHMYCTAGVLTADGKTIYKDFSYAAQPPYHALLLAAFYKVLQTHHYLLVGRLVSVACDVLIVVFIVLIYRQVFGRLRAAGSLFGLAAAATCVFNPCMSYAAGYAWNQDAVMACVAASLWLFLRMAAAQSPNRYVWIGVIVALLTLATCMRITTALIELVFLGAVLMELGGPVRQKVRTTAVFAGVAFIVAVWPIGILMRSPHAVWLDLVRIPEVYGRWLHQIGMVYGKAKLTFECLTAPAYLALLVLVGLTVFLLIRQWSGLDSRTKRHFVLMLALPAVFILIAFIPPTMWPQYWGVPVPFLVMAMAYPLAELTKVGLRRAGRTAITCAVMVVVIVAVVSNWGLLYQSIALLVPEQWAPLRLHATAGKIATQVSGSQRVLTLGPLYALEAGAEIYPELSCGDIIYRAADSLSAEERQLTHTVGPAGLSALTAEAPPAAVLVGIPTTIAALEQPLRRVVPSGWTSIDCGDGLRLYVRPR
jgi:4-amino-4-deoxy-L-arabinose transferase-like glycosyltransferase